MVDQRDVKDDPPQDLLWMYAAHVQYWKPVDAGLFIWRNVHEVDP